MGWAAAQQLVAADTLIEDLIVAGLGCKLFWSLLGTSFHPRAAELGAVSWQNAIEARRCVRLGGNQ